jgi:hypothetical protein
MRATDLLGATVYDIDGQAVGAVRDLHFDAGGRAVPDSGRPAYRLTALECGPVGVAHRLGYGRRTMAGPWPIPALVRRLARRSVVVNWADIARINGSRIDLTVRRADLRALVEVGA